MGIYILVLRKECLLHGNKLNGLCLIVQKCYWGVGCMYEGFYVPSIIS